MRPDSEYYLGDRREVVGECPPLLGDVGRILVATENPRKIEGLNRVLGRYPLIRGQEILQAQPLGCLGEEPAWDNAVLVSRSKVDNVVGQLQGQFGPKTAVFGSDIVVRINGDPYLNLSRIRPLTGDDLKREVATLIDDFSREAEVVWDVATSVSRSHPDLRTTIARRYVGKTQAFDRNDLAALKKEFEADIPGVFGRSTRIQLLEHFPHRFTKVGSLNARRIWDKDGELLDGSVWLRDVELMEEMSGYDETSVEEIQAHVVGGIPQEGSPLLRDLLYLSPTQRTNGRWLLV